MKKSLSYLTLMLFMCSSLNSNSRIIEDLQFKNCTEYAESIEDVMTEGGCDSDIFNMAYSYCKDHMFQGVPEQYLSK